MQSAQLLVPLLLLVLFWFVLMRPARNQQRRVRDLQGQLQVGDEVVLSSGIFGTIRSLDDGRVRLEVAPGVELTVARQAVVRQAEAATEGTDGPAADSEPSPERAPSSAEDESADQGDTRERG